ncbi:OmpH family outer membrane protein [Paracoccaceae bacterium GXU_MW_L88]
MAQGAQTGPRIAQQPILVVDQDQLLTRSARGQALLRQIEAEQQELASENRQIESELEAEEQALAARREAMTPEAFLPLADAFDAKVVRLRAQQQDKLTRLAAHTEEKRQEFFRDIVPLMLELMNSYGATMLLDSETVLFAAPGTNITAEAIRMLDQNTSTTPEEETEND